MANDTIDSGLYQEALSQIIDKLKRESGPVSALAREVVANKWREIATSMFTSGWYTARRMQVDQNLHVAKREPPVQAPPQRRIQGISPEMQARLDQSRQRLNEEFAKSAMETHAVFDQHHDRVLVKLFTDRGISTATAEKLVAEVKKKSRG